MEFTGPTWASNLSSASSSNGSDGLLRFEFLGFSGGSDRNLFPVVFQRAHQLRFDAAAQSLGRNDTCRRTETQNPGAELEFTADVHLHRDSAAADLSNLLRRVPNSRPNIFGD